MTLRELYEAIGNSDIPQDHKVEIKDGKLIDVSAAPGESQPSPSAPAPGGGGAYRRPFANTTAAADSKP